MLLGDADVEGPLREARLEVVQPDRVHIAAVIATTSFASLADVDDLVGEESVQIRPLGCSPVSRSKAPGWNWSASCALGVRRSRSPCGSARGRSPGRRTAWPGRALLHRRAVVAVDRADVLEPEVLEQALRARGVLEPLLHRVQGVVRGGADAGDRVEPLLDQLEDLLVARVGPQRGERVGQAADGRRVGAAVVVDDDDQSAAFAIAMLFSASQAMPPVRAPSPITATTWRSSPRMA